LRSVKAGGGCVGCVNCGGICGGTMAVVAGGNSGCCTGAGAAAAGAGT
jgi:hypothetical protein